MSRIFVRVYTNRKRVQESHSFLVGSEQGGLSTRLGNLVLEEGEAPPLRDLRPRIQETKDGGLMIKRTVMYEEALCAMRFASNLHGLPEDRRFEYRFGIVEEGQEVPVLISEEDEATKPLYDLMNPVLHDLVIVPLTQINPHGEVGAPSS